MKLAIVGMGGHSKVIRDLIGLDSKNKIVALLDDKFTELIVENGVYVGPVEATDTILRLMPDIKFILAVGNNEVRSVLARRLRLAKEYYATLVHPSAWVSPSAKISEGTVIMAKAVINADTAIGSHSIVNTAAIIEHDNQISSFVHVSPNATLTGAVKIGTGVHIGAGASVIPNLEIGEWSVVGAGATVIESVPAFSTAVGVPAKVIKLQLIEGV